MQSHIARASEAEATGEKAELHRALPGCVVVVGHYVCRCSQKENVELYADSAVPSGLVRTRGWLHIGTVRGQGASTHRPDPAAPQLKRPRRN